MRNTFENNCEVGNNSYNNSYYESTDLDNNQMPSLPYDHTSNCGSISMGSRAAQFHNVHRSFLQVSMAFLEFFYNRVNCFLKYNLTFFLLQAG